MNEITIEKNVPIPERFNRRKGLTAVLRQMEIGDSVVVPIGSWVGIFVLAKNVGIKITTKKLPNETARIWRIA